MTGSAGGEPRSLTFRERLDRMSRALPTTFGIGVILLVGLVDYLTGYEFRMDLIYLVPISFAAWYLGRNRAISFSLITIIVAALSDILSGKEYTNLGFELWDTFMTLGFYLVLSLVLARLRTVLDERSILIDDLQRALGEVKELRGILPICSSCKKVRTDEGYWQNVDEYIRQHTNAEFSHGLCRECAMKLYPEYYDKEGNLLNGK